MSYDSVKPVRYQKCTFTQCLILREEAYSVTKNRSLKLLSTEVTLWGKGGTS